MYVGHVKRHVYNLAVPVLDSALHESLKEKSKLVLTRHCCVIFSRYWFVTLVGFLRACEGPWVPLPDTQRRGLYIFFPGPLFCAAEVLLQVCPDRRRHTRCSSGRGKICQLLAARVRDQANQGEGVNFPEKTVRFV